MPETEQNAQDAEKGLPEQMFPDLIALEVFLEEVEHHALQGGVSRENTRLFVNFLRKKYGKGIPESRFGSKMGAQFRAKYAQG